MLQVWPVRGSTVQQQRAQALKRARPRFSVLGVSLANHPPLPCAIPGCHASLFPLSHASFHSVTKFPWFFPLKASHIHLSLASLPHPRSRNRHLFKYFFCHFLSLFFFWDSTYMCIRLFDVVSQLLEAWLCFFFPHPTLFSPCVSVWIIPINLP